MTIAVFVATFLHTFASLLAYGMSRAYWSSRIEREEDAASLCVALIALIPIGGLIAPVIVFWLTGNAKEGLRLPWE